ncbi:MAG: proline dehydrogenase family protein [Candidatus Baltobacteraceae bacterium]
MRAVRPPRQTRPHASGLARRRGGLVLPALRSLILAASGSPHAQRLVTKYGFALGAGRFVAGENAEDFLRVAAQLNARGFAVACGILGENVASAAEAAAVTEAYCGLLQTFARLGLDANVAFKLTHAGLDLDPELAFANAACIAQAAAACGNTMRMDMEQSRYVDATLCVYRRLHERFENVGFVLQSYLRRSAQDLRSLLPLRPNVRLVKGAYLEPAAIAYPDKRDVDGAYIHLADMALSNEGYTALATHDRRIVEWVLRRAAQLGLPKSGRFEFQMLYGIGAPVAGELLEAGYRVRLAVPFGTHWFAYLMRRLAERPANLAFFLKGATGR